METHVSSYFKPIYEACFAEIKKTKSFTDIQKLIDVIFHEREFVDWLKKKNPQKVTPKSYRKFCTQKNFQEFFKSFYKIENKQENEKKKEQIGEQLGIVKKLPPIKTHEYDVDIVKAYFEIKKLLETIVDDGQYLKKEEYLQRILYLITDYCQINNLPIDQVLQIKYPIIVKSTNVGFQTYLGMTMIAFDINKIEAILSYQNILWKGEGLFASFVEHGVYSFVYHNSQFDNNIRLSKIMQWVEKNRVFTFPGSQNEKKGEKTPTLEYGETTNLATIFYYWPYSEEKLTELYIALVLNNKINENKSFLESFKTYESLPVNGTIWKAKQVQLMYLLYLIYKKKKQHNSMHLHDIALKLFRSTEITFSGNGLNTTFNQIVQYEAGKKKLSSGLQSIQEIFENLKLS